MSLIEVTYRTMNEGLLTETKMTTASQSPPSMGGTGHKSGNLGTTQPAGSSTGQRVSFSSASVVPSLFQKFGSSLLLPGGGPTLRVFFAAYLV